MAGCCISPTGARIRSARYGRGVDALPELDELLSSVHVVSLPLSVRFRGVTQREAALFCGPHGWTEFSPFLEYDDDESAAWLAAAIEFGWSTPLRPRRDAIPVNATVPAVAAERVPEVLALYGKTPAHTIKVKVAERGQSLQEDVARVRAVHEAAPQARVRVDANGAWSLEEAKRALDALSWASLEYVEQPVATLADMVELRQWSRSQGPGTLLAADELVRKAEDPLAVARAGAADVIIVKAQPLGGIRRALTVVQEASLPAVVSSALDTQVGIGMGLALAAALPALPYACGLGTGRLFRTAIADLGPSSSPWLVPPRRATPTPEALADAGASPARTAWWRDRIRRCYRRLVDARGHSPE